jgi:methylphosphotriester-DNA--protein-cysteine methyltransferase
MNNQIYKDYISRINRVIDFINSNLKNEITLEQLADVANFSKFHFHRIFTSIVGETLSQFILRRRVAFLNGQLLLKQLSIFLPAIQSFQSTLHRFQLTAHIFRPVIQSFQTIKHNFQRV